MEVPLNFLQTQNIVPNCRMEFQLCVTFGSKCAIQDRTHNS